MTGRLVLVTTFVVGAAVTPADGQELARPPAAAPEQLISANPFGLVGGWYNGAYERRLDATWSVGLGGSHLSLGESDFTSANAIVRYYPQGDALHGFYIGPRLGFYRVFDREDVGDGRSRSFGLGFELGYNWLLGASRNFNLGIGAGATRLFSGDVVPTIRLVNVGWAF